MAATTLTYPATGQQASRPGADRVVVRGYHLQVEPPEEDGRVRIHGTLTLAAPVDAGVARASVQLALRDGTGSLAGVVHLHQEALAAGAEQELTVDQTVALRGEVQRVHLFTAAEHHRQLPLPRGTHATRVLEVRASVGEPDPADGAQAIRLLVELQHTGPPTTLCTEVELHLEGGGTRRMALTPEPSTLDRGHQVVSASEWFLPAEAAATAARAVLSLRERVWQAGPTLDRAGAVTGPPQKLELPALTGTPTEAVPEGVGPWELLEQGHVDAAVDRLTPADLPAGRERLRSLLGSKDPLELVTGARVATACGYRSATSKLRGYLRHDSPLVRRAAVEALGVLAGPSLLVPVRGLLDDPDPDVRLAAADAVSMLDA